MTFTKRIKNEILKSKGESKCCRKSLLYGMLLFSSRFENGKIQFSSENSETTERVGKLLDEFYPDCKYEFFTTSNGEHNEFRIRISEEESTSEIFKDLNYSDGITYKILFENFMCDFCKAAFIKGAFLACASAVFQLL